MSHVPSNWEYTLILLLLASVTASLFARELFEAFRRPHTYLALSIYMCGCTIIDYVAIQWHWWTFQGDKILGLHLISIPAEEYMLFILIFCLTIGMWKARLE